MPEKKNKNADADASREASAGGNQSPPESPESPEQSPAQPQDVQAGGGAEGDAQPGPDDEQQQFQLEAQLATLQRAVADIDNRRKRAERMAEERVQYAVQKFAQDLLPVIDNFERGLSYAGETRDFDALHNGLKLVHDQLLDVLKRHEIGKIDALGQPFDPNQHEAVGQLVSQEHPDHTVIDVQQQGYQMHERVIRPSRVIVSRRPVEQSPESSGDEE